MKRAFSFGGGRQSTAALILAARGDLDVDLFVFANVGDDSENPETLAYIRDYSRPYAKAHGIELVEVMRQFKDGRDPSLLEYVKHERRGVAIPLRMDRTGAPGNRHCTYDWKIRVVAHYLKRERGWTAPWDLALGISWDESQRIKDEETPVEQIAAEGRMVTVDGISFRKVWPLCEKRLRIGDCERIVAEAGLPPVPKSSCWFCPFHSLSAWASMRLRQPQQFAAAVDLERQLSERQMALGRGPLFMTDRLKPLDVAVPEGAEQLGMFENVEGHCTSGYCWT